MPKFPVDFAGPSYFGGKHDQLVLCAGKGELLDDGEHTRRLTITTQLGTSTYGTANRLHCSTTSDHRLSAATSPV